MSGGILMSGKEIWVDDGDMLDILKAQFGHSFCLLKALFSSLTESQMFLWTSPVTCCNYHSDFIRKEKEKKEIHYRSFYCLMLFTYSFEIATPHIACHSELSS